MERAAAFIGPTIRELSPQGSRLAEVTVDVTPRAKFRGTQGRPGNVSLGVRSLDWVGSRGQIQRAPDANSFAAFTISRGQAATEQDIARVARLALKIAMANPLPRGSMRSGIAFGNNRPDDSRRWARPYSNALTNKQHAQAARAARVRPSIGHGPSGGNSATLLQ
jgi:hypothetical protein